jgi:hypothetical protein
MPSNRKPKMSDQPPSPSPPSKKYYTWSEVFGIPRVKARLATIALQPGKFLVTGPDELIIAMQTVIGVMDGQDSEEIKWAMLNLWSNWHVLCSITGNEILLCDLRYWMDGLIYSSPALITMSGQHHS